MKKKILLFVGTFALTIGAFAIAWEAPWYNGIPVWPISVVVAFAISGVSLGIYHFFKND